MSSRITRRTGLTIKRHPLAFLRGELRREGLVAAADLATLPVEPASAGSPGWC